MKGSKTYRHEGNPDEKVFHDTFIEDHHNIMKYIASDLNSERFKILSKREEVLIINTIQWLGSPVGQGFLRDCGFVKKEP
jgi:hypothetical protein